MKKIIRHYHYFINGKYYDHGRDIYKGEIPKISDIIEPFYCQKFIVKKLRNYKIYDGYEIVSLEVLNIKENTEME